MFKPKAACCGTFLCLVVFNALLFLIGPVWHCVHLNREKGAS